MLKAKSRKPKAESFYPASKQEAGIKNPAYAKFSIPASVTFFPCFVP
jgi:hypothetical protein